MTGVGVPLLGTDFLVWGIPPLTLVWIPAHTDPHVLSRPLGQHQGLDSDHVWLNAQADKIAGRTAQEGQVLTTRRLDTLAFATMRQSVWLQRLYKMFPTKDCLVEHRDVESEPESVPPPPVPHVVAVPNPAPLPDVHPRKWANPSHVWGRVQHFFNGAMWEPHPEALTSLLEVALVFYLRERWLPSTADEACTACSLLRWFKATFRIVLKHGPVPAPARWDPQFRKKRGVSFPKGTLRGASLVLSPRECEFIASACARCARQGFTDQDWSFSVPGLG